MPLASLAGSWNIEPLQLAPTLIASLLYLRRTRTLARRGTPVVAWRRAIFWLGIALVVVALNSPVDAIGEHDLFFIHMVQHVVLGDLAPLCFVAGLTGPVLRPVLAFRLVDRLRILTHPFVALPLWAVDLYVWHVPYLYEAALHHSSIHALEHTMFFTCGGLMWAPVVETLPGAAVVRDGHQDRLHRRRAGGDDDPRQRLHLVEHGLLPVVRPRPRRNGASPPCTTRISPGS